LILDLDETVLDNSPFEVEAMKAGVDADWSTQLSRIWAQWINRGAEQAVPGAVEFIRYAQGRGVHVFFVSNRSCPTNGQACRRKAVTQKSLARLGIEANLDTDLLFSGEQGWTDEKSARRARIAEGYRVLMLFGDDFADFLPDVRDPAKSDVEKRRLAAVNFGEFWGNRWFMLPNPAYGSWVSMLGKNKCSLLEDFAKHDAKSSGT
jgi:acid phosphatase